MFDTLRLILRSIAMFCLRLILYFFMGAIIGGVLGSLAAGFAACISGDYVTFGMGFGLPMGVVIGSIACIIAFPFVQHIPIENVLPFLLVYTSIPALVLAAIPELGAVLSMGGSVIGFFIGVILARRSHGKTSKKSEAPEDKA